MVSHPARPKKARRQPSPAQMNREGHSSFIGHRASTPPLRPARLTTAVCTQSARNAQPQNISFSPQNFTPPQKKMSRQSGTTVYNDGDSSKKSAERAAAQRIPAVMPLLAPPEPKKSLSYHAPTVKKPVNCREWHQLVSLLPFVLSVPFVPCPGLRPANVTRPFSGR